MSTRLPRIPSSEITPEHIFLNRRKLLLAGGALGLAAAFPGIGMAAPLKATKSAYSTAETQTPFKDATTYNNFYEFGTGKSDPSENAGALTTRPWSVTVDGLVKTPLRFDVDKLISTMPLEERIYRLRCVEGWSMVIPWIGFPLAAMLKRVEPLASAKFVAFETLKRPKEMVGQDAIFPVLEWPYVEGLRLDEAMHPLTILSVGAYGQTLPKQNGAPIRLVVPWKYGFKSIKSIVRIRLVDKQPATSWNVQAANEYGFYSNVNPAVDHPRWSQATERPIGQGGGLFASRKATLPFNGYADQVAQLYKGMDLKKFY